MHLKLFISALMLSALLAVPALADIGPKPTMLFTFSFSEGGKTHMTGTTLLMCSTDACTDAEPLKENGPQRFQCGPSQIYPDMTANSCHALAYGFKPFSMLEIALSDGRKLRSNVFSKQAFDARYAVTVSATEVTVREQ